MITVSATINSTIDKVWEVFVSPNHITKWNFASDDWCCPSATNELKKNGSFSYRMEAKDGSMGFDLNGTFTLIDKLNRLEYALEDQRKVIVTFEETRAGIVVTQTFEPENENPEELQKAGWQAILTKFKTYTETLL